MVTFYAVLPKSKKADRERWGAGLCGHSLSLVSGPPSCAYILHSVQRVTWRSGGQKGQWVVSGLHILHLHYDPCSLCFSFLDYRAGAESGGWSEAAAWTVLPVVV